MQCDYLNVHAKALDDANAAHQKFFGSEKTTQTFCAFFRLQTQFFRQNYAEKITV